MNDVEKRNICALKESEILFKNVFLQSPVGIVIFDAKGQLLSANNAFKDIFGLKDLKDVRNLNLFENFNMPKDLRKRLKNQKEHRHYLEINMDKMGRRLSLKIYKPGKICIDFIITPLVKDGVYGYLSIVNDITRRKLAEDRVKYLTFHDKITGLYNRLFFEEELKRIDVERSLPLSIIFGDVNEMKLVNDVFGHYEGDKLLANVSKVLKKSTRQEDIVARWGGDEFAILLPNTDAREAQEICNRIKQNCSQFNTTIPISISFGVGTKTKQSQKICHIISEAENIMYANKLNEGKQIRANIIKFLKKKLVKNTDETLEHIERIKKLATEFGEKLGLDYKQKQDLLLLADMHDIGKATLSPSIFTKDTFTPKRKREFTNHTQVGYRIAMLYPEYAHIADYILYHHESWDGSGYPFGLKGEEIPLLARIFNIVHSYDLIKSRNEIPVNHQKVLEELKKEGGKQFDPHLLSKFIELM